VDAHPSLPDVTGRPLPAGWHEVRVPGVDWPVLVGPGGVVVVFTRNTSTALPRTTGDQDERRRATSGAHLTAALVGHRLGLTPDRSIPCAPLVVIDDDLPLVARSDDAAVVHRADLVTWLCDRPAVIDDHTVHGLVAAAPPALR